LYADCPAFIKENNALRGRLDAGFRQSFFRLGESALFEDESGGMTEK
jgi:hypothetical protein